MALPALLGGLARGAAGAGGRGLLSGGARGLVRGGAGSMVKSGVSSVTKGRKDKGGALVKPKQSMVDPDGAIVSMKKSDGGGTGGGASFSSPGPKSEKSTAIVKSNLSSTSSALDILKSVKNTADQILEVEVRDLGTDEEELKVKKEQLDDEKKALEASKRDEEEEKQEEKKQKPAKRKKSNPIVNAAKKTMGGLWDFLTGLLSDFIKFKILDWISDPKNREKITNIVKFIQTLPELWSQFKERFIDPWWNFLSTFVGGGFEIFKSFLTVFIDVLTLKFFTDPQEFLNNLLEIPKTLLRVVPEIINSLLNAVTGGTIKTIGELVDKLFHNPLEGIDFGGIANSLGSVLGNVGNFFKFVGGGLSNIIGGAANAILGGPANAATIPPTTGGVSTTNNTTTNNTTNNNTTTNITTSGSLSVVPQGSTDASQVSGYEITSAYGSREGFRTKDHGGLDIGTPVGTNIALAEDGEIVAAGSYGGYGNLIDAWLPKTGVQLRMAHLASIIKRSGSFKAGEVIGKTGGAAGDPGAGSSTGPHLHFEMDRQKGGAAYGGSGDPTPFAKLLMLGGGTTGKPTPTPSPSTSPLIASTPQPQSGRNLTQVQRENQMLESSGMGALTTPIVTSNSDSSSSVINETISGPSLGSTLPTSGTWSIFKTNL